MNTKIQLSKKQQSIVYAEQEAIYVKASAGSGKTRVLTERVRYLLTLTNKKILTLTFTNKAGQEIKERLSTINHLEKRTFIGTFHGFCQSILENHGNLMGYTTMPHIFEDERDCLELIEKTINQIPSYAAHYKKQDKKQRRDFCYRAFDFISKIKRNLISEDEIEEQTDDDDIILFYRSYQDILRMQNAIDFDDLLLKVHGLFIDFPKIAALYRRSFFAICIDEAQDLNKAQYQLLKVLAGDELRNIMLVGDPYQSIYHFNGSSSDYMDKDFVNDFSPAIIKLTDNYRSSKAVLKAAKQIIPELETTKGTVIEGIFKLYKADDEAKEAAWVVAKIKKMITLKNHKDIEGDICFEKITVLARNKYLFKSLQKELEEKQIPYYYKMTSGMLKFESLLMRIFDLAFRVKLNPQDELHLNRLLKYLSLSNSAIDFYQIIDQLNESNEKSIIELVVSLKNDGSNFKKKLDAFKQQVSLDNENEKNMLFNDIDELLKHWHNYAKKTNNKSLHQFKNAMALGQTHPLAQHSGITLSTVHTMKGQEFDIVFILGMDDQTFPDYRAVRHGGTELIQEKNNLYVAFTRAKRWLYVTWPEYRTMPWGDRKKRSISRFLKNFSHS